MTERLLHLIRQRYPMQALDTGEFSALKVNGMTFSIQVYAVQGLGHLSVMRAKGFFGLMRMDTMMLVPKDKDLPLYSYDRIYAMGNDTLIVELYDTLTQPTDLSALDGVKASYAHLGERDPGEHWYDGIKLAQSISKKGKKAQSPALDALAIAHFEAYLNAPASDVPDGNKKAELSARYVNGLLSQGGPSTDVFKKSLGEQVTERLFKTVLFGTES
ncbi:MAG: hypothetical protein IJW92_02900 [Clostridia bacterium]|nr:hypothetical protein [Clostridia bacterium]